MAADRIYYSLAKPFIGPVRKRLSVLLKYAGEGVDPERWLGHTMAVGLAVFIVLGFILYSFIPSLYSVLAIVVVSFILLVFSSYMLLFFKAENRGKAVEKMLPNFLNLVASNVNSGMTPFQAVKASSRREFGILKDEIDKAISLSAGTMSFNEALVDMTTRIKSKMFRNVVELMIEGMRTGGPLVVLLEDIARYITESLDLRREMATRSRANILFISFIILFGAPLLSAVSINFIKTLTDIRNTIVVEVPEVLQTGQVGGISIGEMSLTVDFLFPVLTINLIITATIASMLIAIISDGRIKYFVKYAIFLTPFSILNLYVLDYVIEYIIG
jgi:flagellar protein FlaJ